MSEFSDPVSLPASELPRRRRVRLHPKLRRVLAWVVHFYTATGLILAAAMTVAILQGTPGSFRTAFVLMLVATLVDATDGTFARLIKIKEVLPGFDGRRLDDLVDFQTYVTLPLLLIWQARLLPPGQEGWLVLPLLAAAYGFCQVDAKTPDGYFLGFPSYWNIVSFYLYVFQPSPGLTLGLVVALALLTFVPSRYLYATQPGRLNRLTNQLGAVWCVLLVWVLWLLPTEPPPGETADTQSRLWAAASLLFPGYYLVVSWGITMRYWGRRRKERKRQKGVALADRPADPRTA
jgi:phosphatidylcholine synthase